MSAAEERSPRRRVLVVDDDPEIVTFLATLLELEGIDSTVATSAAAALEKLDHVVPNLVLLDIAMPDRDGIDLCRELRRVYPHISADAPAGQGRRGARSRRRRGGVHPQAVREPGADRANPRAAQRLSRVTPCLREVAPLFGSAG